MRTTFIKTLCEMAAEDARIWLLCGDLGYSVLETFRDAFADRFVNVGVAEQNMIGLAAGLALCGKIVYVYSIANFPVMRCLEQIRNDVCYHNLNVRIVAVGGGLAYGSQGYTHHGVEDIAVMRVMPGMTVLAPADPHETQILTRASGTHAGPCFIRLGKANEPRIHPDAPTFGIGDLLYLRHGSDISIVAIGSVLQIAIDAAAQLEARGIHAAVISMPTVWPCNAKALLAEAAHTRHILTIEEHGQGGLGSIVGECIAQSGLSCRFHALRLQNIPLSVSGSHNYLKQRSLLSVESAVASALQLLAVPQSE